MIALSKLYSLNDPRVAQTLVKGDLIIPQSDRIMTRSKTKNSTTSLLQQTHLRSLTKSADPDQFTIIPAPVKIVKVLIEELLSASGRQPDLYGATSANLPDDEGEDDGWEDVPNSLDLGLPSSKAQLMAWSEGAGHFTRQQDDETQTYLIEFFTKASQENIAGFSDIYAGALNDEEREKLSELAQQGVQR